MAESDGASDSESTRSLGPLSGPGSVTLGVGADAGTVERDPALDRRAVLRRVGALVLAANVVLFGAKTVVWLATGSLAVGSEAANSLADAVYSLVVLAGLYLTTRPPDTEHPHGHERIEPFVSLFVAAGVVAAGAVVLYTAGDSLLSGAYVDRSAPGVAAPVVLVVSAVVKYGLYRYSLSMGRRTGSPALVAAAMDDRADVLTAGAALVGVLAAVLGVPVADPLAALLVGAAVVYAGVGIVRDNVNYLVGGAPPESLREEIVARAREHPDVRDVHDVVAHYVGPEVDVSLHVEVDGDMPLREAHDLEIDVVEAIRSHPAVDDVFVHLDPRDRDEWVSTDGRDDGGGATDAGRND
jgi:cation diffusion facilitator family transporter